jgi:hypothetical protein
VALFQDIRMAIGFKKQAALHTPLVAADMWSLRFTSQDVPQATPINEDDADDLGKGVYATEVFPSHLEAAYPVNGRLTSQWAAMLACFGSGKTVKTAAGSGFKYTCVAPDLSADGLELPSTTVAVKIPEGGGNVTDKALIGIICNEFGFQLNSGPGRDNAQFTSSWVGSGKYAQPSAITIPTFYAEKSLNSGGISALTILGQNYLTNNRFISYTFGWQNQVRPGFYPGSGSQGGYQLQGRMRRGKPVISTGIVVEAAVGSAEEAALLAGTEGTAVMTLDGPVIGAGPEVHQLKITHHRIKVKGAPLGNQDGIVTYGVDLSVLQHATNGVVTIEVTTDKDLILTAAS